MRIHIVTLSVKDITRARHFYESVLSFKASSSSSPNFVAFKSEGVALCLYGRDELSEDVGMILKEPASMTLAHNVATRDEVAPLLLKADSHGGMLVKPAQDTPWGGHSGYFADPDGHLWEIAWNPFWPGVEGELQLP